jgi:hypothetical protein
MEGIPMIRFLHPLLLIALAILPVLFFLVRRRRRGLAWRLLTVAFVLVALAGPQVGRRRPAESVVFLIDRSPSVAATTTPQAVSDQVEAIVSANPDRRFGAIAFAKRAVVTDLVGAPHLALTTEVPLGEATDLDAAVVLALASLPERGTEQFVLVSDGRITDGLTEALAEVERAGIPVSTLPLGEVAEDDAALVSLVLPPEVEVGRPFSLEMTVLAHQEGEATIALYREEDLIALREISLHSGLNRIPFTNTLIDVGLYTYRALVKRPSDPIPENDALSAMVQTVERPQLLVVSKGEESPLEALLRATGKPFSITRTLPDLEGLAGYREVLLAGVPLAELPSQAVETLRTFVGDLGGGLVVVEGEEALRGFAGGGIERILPISYTLPQEGREASLCLVYLLDRSASMRGHAEGAAKIDILKEAVAASVNLLDEETLVGVIAFDRHYEWLVPIQPLGDGSILYEGLRSLEATGGTDLYYPIVDAVDAIEPVEARVKHILLFSDGKTVDEYRDFPSLFARLEEQEAITVSAIGIGNTPNLPLLGALVSAGHGTLYTVSDFSALPQISVQVTQRLSRNRFITGESFVSGPLATGELAELPPLSGYALTYPKPTAETLLWVGEDPILARWRLGLGRVAVLNTELAGKWSGEWLSWEKGGLLLDAILTTAEPVSGVSFDLHPSVEVSDDGIDVLVDARDLQGKFANFLDLEATLLPTGGTQAMEQVGPGLYRTSFPAKEEGGYALRINDRTRDQQVIIPICIPYPAEYRKTGIDEETLQEIARATGGHFLTDEILPSPAPGGEAVTYVDVHSHLLLAALALFLVELAVRKLPRRRQRP